MRKVLYQCIGNVLLFTLFGLAFLYPFTNVSQTEGGVSGTLTIFPLLLAAYLIIYPIVNYMCRKVFQWDRKDNSELSFSDEREQIIVAEAVKVSYKVLIGGLIASIAAIGGVRCFASFARLEISSYFVSILLLTVVLVVAMVSYAIKWCVEYRK